MLRVGLRSSRRGALGDQQDRAAHRAAVRALLPRVDARRVRRCRAGGGNPAGEIAELDMRRLLPALAILLALTGHELAAALVGAPLAVFWLATVNVGEDCTLSSV